jgi:hypothetical protein
MKLFLFLSDIDSTKYNSGSLTSALENYTVKSVKTLNKSKSCINWTLDKVLIQEIFKN